EKTVSLIKTVSDEKADSNTKEVYQIFKEYVTDKFPTHEDFINDIIRFVTWYKWIISEIVTDTISYDATKDKEIKELLRNIFHDIKAEAFKSFILGLLEYNQQGVGRLKLSDNKLIEILEVIRTYLIRRRILGLAQGENKSIVLLSDKIRDLSNSTTSMIELLSNMFYKMRTPNDKEVSERLKTIDFYNDVKKYSKFILGKIEENNTKVAVDFRNPKISIEHIMPQTFSDFWKDELGDDSENIHKQYLHNIGNLILTEFNDEIGNKSFADKKDKLNKSSLNFRLDVICRNSWNDTAIKDHQTNMIAWFLETFPLPDAYKTSNNWNTRSIEKVNFSPLDDEAGEIAEGNKPSKLLIKSDVIAVRTWQDVFIEFLKWIKKSADYDYDSILVNQEKLFGKEHIIIKWKNFKSLIDEHTDSGKRYKTFENNAWDSKSTVLEDDLEFIHINASAKSFMTRIANIMNQFGMSGDYVEIVLK
uniref:HNH endonuclease family protein n=2 Tax=Treponema endosymbiont of Eucomonympha sp. TaxID=1580831 RepID=UPI000A6B105C